MFKWFTDRFSLGEIAGSLGDISTLLPITLSMAKKGLVNVGTTFMWGGIFNIIGGIYWDMPIPVQPMKTIGSVAVSGGLTTPGSISVAGMFTGLVVGILGYFKIVEKIAMLTPGFLIGIIQVGTGLKFSINGITQIKSLTNWVGFDSYLMAIISALIVCFNFSNTKYSKYFPSALILFVLGLILSGMQTTLGSYSVFNPFRVTSFISSDWEQGIVKGAIPQIPLTILNSVIGVVDLSRTLYGVEKGLTTREASLSLGAINLLGCGFQGMPSCHGAGGLSGQHKFGGRTGLTSVIIGVLKVLVSIFFGNILVDLLGNFPTSILSVMLTICGSELCMQGLKRVKSHHNIFVLGLTVAIVCELWIGFLVGVILYLMKFDEEEEPAPRTGDEVKAEEKCIEIQTCC